MTVGTRRRPVVLARQPGIGAAEAQRLSLALADRFVALLSELTPQQWETVTSCDPWTVKDIAAHLLGWADAICSPRAMAAQARLAFARRKRLGGIVDAQNDVQVEAARSQSPAEILERLRVMLPKAARVRRRVGGTLRYFPAYMSFLGGAINVGYLMNVIFLRDLLVHALDVAHATGRGAELGAAEARVIADMVKDWARRTGADATIELAGPAGGTFVAGNGGRASITADAGAFAWLLAGRAAESPVIEGDVAAAEGWIARGCPV
jgi:uncharacterized protein (TIGR03083 family)